jgi:hypothetical protein
VETSDLLEQLDGHLCSPNISWLLGAGISRNANIPLMYPLTDRVLFLLKEQKSKYIDLINTVISEIDDRCHVEHLLSHFGDYAALADRAKTKEIAIGGSATTCADIDSVHGEIVNAIADTIRWGYAAAEKDRAKPELIGTQGQSITDVRPHREFVAACFKSARAGLNERRGAVKFFTTNYDTLLEDALSLSRTKYWDGFEGGAVAYKAYRLGDGDPPPGYAAHVIKLHGSIDWHLNDDDGRVYKVRYGDTYPAAKQRVLIYPQATKYIAAQRDPFSAQFELFRRALMTGVDSTIAVCGYSFGDDHINQELEMALARPDSKTTLVAFCFEADGKIPSCLDEWRTSSWGSRVYVASNKGLYVGNGPPKVVPSEGELHWWTFDGVTKILMNGSAGAL